MPEIAQTAVDPLITAPTGPLGANLPSAKDTIASWKLGIVPTAVAASEHMLKSAKDTVKAWMSNPQAEADLKNTEISANTTKPASLEASTSGDALKMEPDKTDEERRNDLAMGLVGGGVIKDVGGQWLTKGVEEALGKLKKHIPVDTSEEGAGLTPILKSRQITGNALNSWIDGALRKYVLNRMATPDDEIRALAEDGVLHVDSETLHSRTGLQGGIEGYRNLGGSELAKRWEHTADSTIHKFKAGTLANDPANKGRFPEWMDKLDPETDINALIKGRDTDLTNRLGFDHLVDVLGAKLATGELRPEQLSKVSVKDAVQMAHDDRMLAEKKMLESRKAAQEGMTVHKEYPEGWKWVQLDKPGQFAAESDAMGHSVRGYEPPARGSGPTSYARTAEEYNNHQPHPDWIPASGDSGYEDYGHGGWDAIKSGKAKVYSLRDAKGESHVTVEVGPWVHPDSTEINEMVFEEAKSKINRGDFKDESEAYWKFYEDRVKELKNVDVAIPKKENQISQIKGKLNKKPSEAALPYVQDFVKSGKWSDVGDLQNTDFVNIDQEAIPWPKGATHAQVKTVQKDIKDWQGRLPQYMTREEFKQAASDLLSLPRNELVKRGMLSDKPSAADKVKGWKVPAVIAAPAVAAPNSDDKIDLSKLMEGISKMHDLDKVRNDVLDLKNGILKMSDSLSVNHGSNAATLDKIAEILDRLSKAPGHSEEDVSFEIVPETDRHSPRFGFAKSIKKSKSKRSEE